MPTMHVNILQDATVDELFQLLNRKTGIPLEESRLIHAGKELVQGQGKRISDYPSIVHGSTLFMVMRLLGGLDVGKQPDEACQLTNEPDMITWDDDPNETRVKMPCGHAISPESLTAYCRSIVDAGKFQFICPYVNPTSNARCNKEWDYIEVRRFAVLTTKEQKFFETKISENYLQKAVGIQECPGCKSYCERANIKDKRLICKICTKTKQRRFDFCWSCLHEWKTAGIDKCGNEECGGEDPRLRILRDAPMKDVVGVQTPSCRACPNCGLLIEHTKACKHMVCRCGTQFCFICLKLKDATKGWQCGIYNTKCTVADRQTVLVGL